MRSTMACSDKIPVLTDLELGAQCVYWSSLCDCTRSWDLPTHLVPSRLKPLDAAHLMKKRD
jgi:hypothetical protein